MIKMLIGCTLLFTANVAAEAQQTPVSIHFRCLANGRALMRDSIYENSIGEKYSVTGLKFYVSNISFKSKNTATTNTDVFLVNAFAEDHPVVMQKEGRYDTIEFLLGVDSALNNSGAQDGALDPLNGMFWTWNSGYIFFKLQGYSDASTADLHRIEHHIGGYQAPFMAMRKVVLPLPAGFMINNENELQVDIILDLDKYWNGAREISIADAALIMSPGAKAVIIADNFPFLFSIAN